jgi:hypothetical protein
VLLVHSVASEQLTPTWRRGGGSRVKARTLWKLVFPTMAVALLVLALLVGGAAGGKGKGPRGGGHGNTHNGQTGYHFQVLNQVPGTPNRLLIQGSGTFNAHRAHGGGTFDHFIAGTGPPAAFGSTGTGAWRANDVVSWTPGLTHGVYQGGTLVMHATFYPIGKAPIPNVTIAVYCNLGPAGFSVSPPHAEGADVTVPGSPQLVFTQTPSGTSPNTGITIFVVPKRDIHVS